MKFRVAIILVLVVVCALAGNGYAQVAEQDSLALVALYNSTDGPNWTNNTNWLTEAPVSEWYGVTASGGRVTELDLPENNLSGMIPSELGNLTNLTWLYLNDNQLTGSIPYEIGNLTNLRYLSLRNNQLTGSVPPEIGNLTNLVSLYLYDNQLTGSIPPEIGNLTNLLFLGLANNQLTGSIPPEIGNLTNLKTMILQYNQLTGSIPPELGNLNLTHLFLYKNQLTGSIPPEIGNLTNLTHLSLSDNQLTGSIPPEIGNLTNLTDLSLSNNQLTGSIPPEIGNLTNLTWWFLSSTQLTGSIPPEIGNLTNLTRLFIHNNQLTGSIPPEIGNLTNLQLLSLDDNQLTGTIPAEIGNLTNLIYLRLEVNQLTGSIPSEIGNMTNLTGLYLRNNQFIELPDLTPLTSLKYLLIYNNRFTFEDIEPNIGVPSTTFTYAPQDSVGEHQNIMVSPGDSLTVSVTVGGANNQYQWKKDGTVITGATDSTYTIGSVNPTDAGSYTCEITNTIATDLTLYSRPISVTVIPVQTADQDSLALVALYNSTDGANWYAKTNWLTEAPVSEWHGVTVIGDRITELHLQENNLSGSIPSELGNMNNLLILELTTNQLTGPIPAEIWNLTNLAYLHFGGNQLTGLIPPEIGNLTNLTTLVLGGNQLTGSIPPEIGNLTNLIYLDLHSNQLTGSIPSEIGNLTNITYLKLSWNQLTGSIPPELGNLTNLTFLDLSSNQLTGSIPPEIGNLTNLRLLGFSSNQLTGSIPSEIGNLTNLTRLWLSSNQLTGPIPPEIWNLTNLTDLVLYDNQLSGSIPPEIGNLTNLDELWLYNNQFIDLPDLSAITSLQNLTIENNRLTFEDIEPNIGVPSTIFTYAPQDSVGEHQNITVSPGESLTISVTVGGEHNIYQWFKDGSLITGANDSTYTMDPVSITDAGAYTCEITNTVAIELTLYSRPIHVFIEYVLGDGNGNGRIDIGDAVILINYLLELGLPPDPIGRGDCNQNGRLDIGDVVMIINHLLFGTPIESQMIAQIDSKEEIQKSSVDSPETIAQVALSRVDQKITLDVETETDVAGVFVKIGYDSNQQSIGTPTLAQRCVEMKLGYNITDNGLNLVIYSMEGKRIEAGNGTLLYIPVQPKEGVIKNDALDVTIDQISLSDSMGSLIPVETVNLSANLESSVGDTPLNMEIKLNQNYPNPFNPDTTVEFMIPSANNDAYVEFNIYNLQGQLVRTLLNTNMSAGFHSVRWNGKDVSGKEVSGGMYIYQLKVNDFIETKKMLFMK